MLRRVPSNTNTRTQKKRIWRKSIIHIHFSFISVVLVCLNNKYMFQNVLVNVVMAQTFLPGVTNGNTGVSRREIQVFDPQA